MVQVLHVGENSISFMSILQKFHQINYLQYCVITEREAMVFANPRELFYPRGAAELPRDEMAAKGQQKHSLPLGDHATVLLQRLLNKNNKEKLKSYNCSVFDEIFTKFFCIFMFFRQFDEIFTKIFCIFMIFRQFDEKFALPALGSLQNLFPIDLLYESRA